MQELIDQISGIVWGPVTIILLVGTGIFVTLIVKAIQVRKFFYSWGLISGKYDNPEDKGEVTHFQALSAALSATIGTGNIAGVGTASVNRAVLYQQQTLRLTCWASDLFTSFYF